MTRPNPGKAHRLVIVLLGSLAGAGLLWGGGIC